MAGSTMTTCAYPARVPLLDCLDNHAAPLAPDHDSWGERSLPPGTPKMADICASGSAWPSVTSVLVTVKLGTTGKRANGSFMVCPLQ